jgi:suppressor for copper-sensitivity B
MRLTSIVTTLGLLSVFAAPAAAQLGDFGLGGGGASAKDPVYSAKLFVVEGSKEGVLEFELQLPEGYKTYDVSEPAGGIGMPSTMKLPDPKKTKKPNGLDFAGPWVSDHEPKMVEEEGEDHPVHSGTVVWKARVKFEEGVDPKTLKLKLKYNGQMCAEGVCQPIPKDVEVKFAGAIKKEEANALPLFKKTADAPADKPVFSAKLFTVPKTKDAVIEFTMALPEGAYTYAVNQPIGGVGLPSTMKVAPSKSGAPQSRLKIVSDWAPNESPKVALEEGTELFKHTGTVTWKAKAILESDYDPKVATTLKYEGLVCDSDSCERTFADVDLIFAGELMSTEASFPVAASSTTSPPARYSVQGADVEQPFGIIILFALAGGFILNFMPCVLPVIGLKIASFVEQAGESRSRVILLNVCYSLGLLFVFMILATLAAFFSFGWGQQNQSAVFNIIMACIVFAMGLSMIGVWEIPIPGLAMSTSANKLSQTEGPQGAFFKGVLTTILAVPCSGPGLTTALTYCQNKPPAVIYLVFAFLALGMATPYLLIGAFPAAIRFLPKPGEWMETFKQVMGFILLGTVVFLLSYIQLHYVVPTVALLFGIWMACWWFGRVPAWESTRKRYSAALMSTAMIAVIGLFCFGWLDDVMLERTEKYALRVADQIKQRLASGETESPDKLAWKPFSPQKLGELTSSRKLVMVDFTADWCLTCKTLEKTVLNTKAVKDAVQQYEVETLMADWTEPNEEIANILEQLGSKEIPKLAIFPADDPSRPIVLKGLYSQQALIDSLRKAAKSEAIATKQAAKSTGPSSVAAKPALADKS